MSEQNLEKFLNRFATCPVCRKQNHVDSLKSLYYSNDPIKMVIKNQLVGKKLDRLYNLQIGIACCSCYSRIFCDKKLPLIWNSSFKLKIILVCANSSRKTALIQNFVRNRFAANYKLTVGVDILTRDEGSSWAVRVFTQRVDDAERRYEYISEFLKKHSSPYFIGFSYHENGIQCGGNDYPMVKMEWIKGELLNDYISSTLENDDVGVQKQKLNQLKEDFYSLINWLEDHEIAHGDLQHGNIMVNENGEIKLVDYDNTFIPEMKGKIAQITTSGLKDYQNPNRILTFDKYMDRFSSLIIFTTLLVIALDPSIIQRLKKQNRSPPNDSLLLRSSDYSSINASVVFKEMRDLANSGNNNDYKILNRLLDAIEDSLANPDDLVDSLEKIVEGPGIIEPDIIINEFNETLKKLTSLVQEMSKDIKLIKKTMKT